jgi:omega-amidase
VDITNALEMLKLPIGSIAARILTGSRNKQLATYLAYPHQMSSFSSSSSAPSSSAPSGAIFSNNLKIAICQMRVGTNKEENIQRAAELIGDAVGKQAQMVVLPEIWNSPYSTSSFPLYAEAMPEIGQDSSPSLKDCPSSQILIDLARRHKIWLVGGSIPEFTLDKDNNKMLYNTCIVLNPEGLVVAKHRKVHLFDINVPGKITFRESDSLTAGSNVSVFETPWGNVGVGICYDIRFPEYAMLLRQRGCRLLVYPGAFNMTTGPAHWELLQRGRAVDNQCFVVTCSPARDEDPAYKGYVPWGHSSVVSPWGDIEGKAGALQEVMVVDIDFEKAESMRQNIPCWSQKRSDLYKVVDLSKL